MIRKITEKEHVKYWICGKDVMNVNISELENDI